MTCGKFWSCFGPNCILLPFKFLTSPTLSLKFGTEVQTLTYRLLHSVSAWPARRSLTAAFDCFCTFCSLLYLHVYLYIYLCCVIYCFTVPLAVLETTREHTNIPTPAVLLAADHSHWQHSAALTETRGVATCYVQTVPTISEPVTGRYLIYNFVLKAYRQYFIQSALCANFVQIHYNSSKLFSFALVCAYISSTCAKITSCNRPTVQLQFLLYSVHRRGCTPPATPAFRPAL